MLAAVLAQGLAQRRLTRWGGGGRELHGGMNALAEFLIRKPKNRGVGHALVRQEDVFNFPGVNVDPAADDGEVATVR